MVVVSNLGVNLRVAVIAVVAVVVVGNRSSSRSRRSCLSTGIGGKSYIYMTTPEVNRSMLACSLERMCSYAWMDDYLVHGWTRVHWDGEKGMN